MTTTPDAENPFQGLAEEASATLRELLVAEGLADEIPAVLPPFERAIRASVAAVEGGAPDDVTLEFALAYLTGRIAKEQVIALQSARAQVNAARERAEHHWRGAIEAERRRLALEAQRTAQARRTEPA
ncbi:MAG TPA: hypothetical protein VFQ25_06320 [Ktedonobacterales bacterium]|nr:hypothetical protein [Ktedonobacterales bacterium]